MYQLGIRMKKIILLTLVVFCSKTIAQKKEITHDMADNHKNEIRLDYGKILVSGSLQLTYEHFFNRDFFAGAHILIPSSEDVNYLYSDDIKRTFQFEPFVRYSISKRSNRFFYVGSYLNGIFSKKEITKRIVENPYAYYDKVLVNNNTIGLGFEIGYRSYTRKRISFDYNFGLSRTFRSESSTEIVPKLGLSVGYRFK